MNKMFVGITRDINQPPRTPLKYTMIKNYQGLTTEKTQSGCRYKEIVV
jgi:hypothetical protein